MLLRKPQEQETALSVNVPQEKQSNSSSKILPCCDCSSSSSRTHQGACIHFIWFNNLKNKWVVPLHWGNYTFLRLERKKKQFSNVLQHLLVVMILIKVDHSFGSCTWVSLPVIDTVSKIILSKCCPSESTFPQSEPTTNCLIFTKENICKSWKKIWLY